MRIRFLVVALLLLVAASVTAQVTSATLEGTVKGPDGQGLPGVTVTAKSPALMGERTAVTAAGGDYVIRGLPPGDYTVTFSLEGMSGQTVKRNLPLGLNTRIDADMKVSAVTEAITVTGGSPTVLETQTVGANIKAATVQQLPVVRTPTGIASLSAGVTDRTPVANQLSISGGIAYDNNFLINGVNMQDNIFGNTNNLFIEDAIQETQVLTSGISAEYGHFTGGVLNVITKSGGNDFTGSLRDNMTKGTWLSRTPFEKGFRGVGLPNGKDASGNPISTQAVPSFHSNTYSHVYEGTVGGPILRDHLWFFLAGRQENTSAPATPTAVTGEAFNVKQTNRRPEIKLSGTIGSGHSLQFDYIDNPVKRDNEVQLVLLDLNALAHNSSRPNTGVAANYSGVFTSTLFGEARWSQKKFGFRNTGGTSTDIHDSPFRTSTTANAGVTASGTFNGPYFDSTDPEDRNNKQAFAALSYFLATPKAGSHDIKGGWEQFVDTRTGGNSQSSTNYVFYGGYARTGTTPILDASGHLQPDFVPCPVANRTGGGCSFSNATRIGNWIPTRGAELDTTTDSFFLNDRWNLNSNFTFNIGGRYEKVKTDSTGGLISIDTTNISPRLGASYDPKGDGRYKFDVTYAEYAGRYNPALAGANTVVGRPSLLYGYYIAAAGQGRDFAPGFDPNNYKFYLAQVPTANIFTDQGMHSPVSAEYTFSAGTQLPKNGWLKATWTDRHYKSFIEDFIDNPTSSGCTSVTLQGITVACQDNVYYRNTSVPKRHYQAVEVQSHYDITRNWGWEGNITHQFKNDGNYEGEGGQTIPTSAFGNRPEIQELAREFAVGHLAQYEQNKLRLWTTYNFNLHKFGTLQAGLLYRYDSPLTFSYTTSVSRSSPTSTTSNCTGAPAGCVTSAERNPGYKQPGGTVTLFFDPSDPLNPGRGIGTFNSTSLFDTSVQYSIPVAGKVTPWIKFDVRNVFNKDTLVTYNTTIAADANSPKDSFGYRTGFTKATTFGRPASSASYVRPREYLLYTGIRF
jgi:hypothetical protein